jgi:hypothetical protein
MGIIMADPDPDQRSEPADPARVGKNPVFFNPAQWFFCFFWVF